MAMPLIYVGRCIAGDHEVFEDTDRELQDLLNLEVRWASFGSAAAAAKLLQSYPTLCNPIDGNPPGSAIPGILQARTLEWVAISFSNTRK